MGSVNSEIMMSEPANSAVEGIVTPTETAAAMGAAGLKTAADEATSATAKMWDQSSEVATHVGSEVFAAPPVAKIWLSLMNEGLQRNIAAMNAIKESRSAQEMLQIQSEWVRDSLQAMSEAARHVTAASMEAWRPAQIAVARRF